MTRPPAVADRAGSLRAVDGLLAAAVLTPLVLFGLVAVYDRQQTLRTAERDLFAILDTLHGHAEKVFEFQTLALGALDLRLRGLSDAQIIAEERAHHEHLQELRRHTGRVLGLVVFGADGHPLVDSERLPAPRALNVGDREYFRRHRDRDAAEPFIAPPVASRAAGGAATFFVTLRRAAPDGRGFGGVLAAGIRQTSFIDYWNGAVQDPDASIVLIREDGTALVRRPALDPEERFRFPPDSPLMRLIAAGTERRVIVGTSPVDGTRRLLAYRRLQGFPVYIAHGMAWSSALAPWHRRLAVYGAVAAAASLALAALAVFARRRALALTREVEERRRAEDEVRLLNAGLEESTRRLAEANAELHAFTYSVAHDLRAPLRTMQGFSQALLEDYEDRLDGEGRDYLGRIMRGARQLDDLIQDLLAYSRLAREEIPLAPVSLALVTDQVLAQFSTEIAERGATVEVDRASLLTVPGHAAVLSQVLANLVGNGLKFVAAGTSPRLRIYGEARGDRVRVWVEDNGIGIAPEHRARVFDVFQRLHGAAEYEGTGIGLAIVRKGIERLGGRVGIESEPGRGSRFWFELKRAERG